MHEIQICDGGPMWLVTLSSKYVYTTWTVTTKDAICRHMRCFPQERVQEKSIRVKVAGPDVSDGDYCGSLFGIGHLLHRASMLFEILPCIPRDMIHHVHINVTGEWWNLRCPDCTDGRSARVEDIVNLFTFWAYDITGPGYIKSYLESRLPLPKFTFSHFHYNTLGETNSEQ
jgi:hypothetical protein